MVTGKEVKNGRGSKKSWEKRLCFWKKVAIIPKCWRECRVYHPRGTNAKDMKGRIGRGNFRNLLGKLRASECGQKYDKSLTQKHLQETIR